MPAHPIPKTPDGTYYLPLRGVPGEVLIALETAAKEEGRSTYAQAIRVLKVWARRRKRG
jgi:hypothetical protein